MRGYIRLAVLCAIALGFAPAEDARLAELRQVELHNEFAAAYNHYSAERNRGVFNLRSLRAMRRAWRRLEQEAGWPKE